MPSTTRRRLLASVGGLLGFAGCSGERQPQTTETTDHEETTQRTETIKRPETTHRSQTTYPPQTDRPGWVGLEVENNDEETHEVTVEVVPAAKADASNSEETTDEELFARTLTLRPQSEPEFNSVVPIPESGERDVRVVADLVNSADGADGTDDPDSESTSTTFTVSADAEYQRLYVTIDRNGVLNLTQGTEPAEPMRTTTSE